MNVKDFHHLSLFGRPMKRRFSLNFSMYDYVLDKKFKLGFDQATTSIPVSAEYRNGYLIIAEDDGYLNLINCEQMYNVCRFKAHNNSILDIKFRPNISKQVLTASCDRSIVVWDLDNQKILEEIDCGSTCSIKAVDFYDTNIFATGGRDGYLRLWDLRTDKKQVQWIKDVHRNNLKSTKKASKRSHVNKEVISDPNSVVTAVLFDKQNYLYSAGANDGLIKIWDLRCFSSTSSNNLIYLQKLHYCGLNEKAEGFTSLALDSKHQLYASCTDNRIYSYNYKGSVGIKQECDYVKSFKGASVTNYTRIKVLNDDLLISGSSQAEACIWSLDDAKNNYYNYPKVTLPHGFEEVSVITCNESNYEIYTCDDTTNLFKWKVNSKLNNQNYKSGEYSAAWENLDQNKDERIVLGKPRRILSPKSTFFNLQNMTTGVKRPYFMTRA